ncbi:hypothetical protein [Streptomyces jumonjinensis]|uniref:Uncharacterized protein n=1 Tax=Streptomyces jumonjinensis TaxID=1945 RepID=A0A646KPX7_STRJU|nr:hypothetical protein [Streptomyces jumonjinensis]MQT04374.1 hypothetical protein [Streptomyces jumonjinensis]
MTTYRIAAPQGDYTDPDPGDITFVDGAATTSDPAIFGYCQGARYTVESLDDAAPPGDDPTADQNGPPDTTSAGRSAARSKPKG